MPKLSTAELRERLNHDLPGAIIETQPTSDGAAQDGDRAVPHPKRGAERLVSLLATSDVVIMAARLPDVARYMRDQLDFQLLSNITAVDYLAEGVIELVYHFINVEGGPPLVVKTRVPRDKATVPSLTSWWPGADLQEREAFDLFGVQFAGHPNLRRVYMWEEFEGHPMRKDFPKHGDKYMEGDE